MQWALVQQPALFDRAYGRLFAKELSQTGGAPSLNDSSEAWAVKRFWQTQHGPGLGADLPLQATSEPLSRYQSDFQVCVWHE